MENQKALQTSSLKAIGKRVVDLGFRQNLSLQAFHRRTDFGKQSLHISFIPNQNDIDITADVGIRFDHLEEFLFSILDTRFMSERDRKNSFSFGCELGRLKGNGQMRWTIVDASDVEPESENIVSLFKSIGLPYLEKYSDMCRVYDVVSVLSNDAELLNAVPEKQARNAVALAYLCNKDKAALRTVTDMMRARLIKIPNANIDEFSTVVGAVFEQSST